MHPVWLGRCSLSAYSGGKGAGVCAASTAHTGSSDIRAHICANFIEHPELKPPFICLVTSGGHSHIILVKDYTDFEVLGQTRDDAAGEAFDKVARVLGLGYPGGPKIDKTCKKQGDEYAVNFKKVTFGADNFDFSFSGIETGRN